jgi:hypothetical protein
VTARPFVSTPSLFVVSLPRSVSSIMYHIARLAVDLREPGWTMDGEILNVDRMVNYLGPRDGASSRFTTPETDKNLFDCLVDMLDQVVQPIGFAYKDVIQPFVVSEWLTRQPLRVLKIVRPVADVAFSMSVRDWRYPAAAAPDPGDSDHALVQGLVRAARALHQLPGAVLHFEDLVIREDTVARCLSELYPDTAIKPVCYIDESFTREHYRQLARRGTPRYRALQEIVDQAGWSEAG